MRDLGLWSHPGVQGTDGGKGVTCRWCYRGPSSEQDRAIVLLLILQLHRLALVVALPALAPSRPLLPLFLVLSRSQEDSATHPSLSILEEHRAAHGIPTVGLEIFRSDGGRAGNSESPLAAQISPTICRSPAVLCPPSHLAPPLRSSSSLLRGCPSESLRTRALGGRAPFRSRPGLCLEEARETGEGSRRFAGILSPRVPNSRGLPSPEL